jgi:hypothetical protein
MELIDHCGHVGGSGGPDQRSIRLDFHEARADPLDVGTLFEEISQGGGVGFGMDELDRCR